VALCCALATTPALSGDAPVDVWTNIVPPLTPPSTIGGAIVENDVHGLILLLGAPSIPLANSAWRFDGEAWAQVSNPPIATIPEGLAKPTRFAATGDTGRAHSLLFGGVVSGEFTSNTITFDGETFRLVGAAQLSTPPARADAALAYIEPLDLVVLFGGEGDNGLLGDTWVWNGESWSAVNSEANPAPRTGHAMAYDPTRGYVVMYGGTTSNGNTDETWLFDGDEWTLYTFVGPSPRSGQAMFYDEGRERVVLVGGLPQDPGVTVAETWEWTGTNWRTIQSGGPSPRIDASAAYDSARGLAVLFGGISPDANLLNDTWELKLESPFEPGIETPVGLRPSDVTAGLFDDDEFPDAVVTDTLRASLFYFRNLGVTPIGIPRGAAGGEWNGFDAPMEIPLAGPPSKTEAVDLNNDGQTDILVAIPSGGEGEPGSQFLLGNGMGGFSSASTLLDDFGQDDVQPGDLDNVKDDLGVAFTDIAYVSTANGIVGVVEGNATGFDPPLVLNAGGEPTRIALGDLNNDGFADIVFTDRVSGTVAVILQNPNGKTRFDVFDRIDFPVGLPGGEPVALVLFDFDGDEDLDVATADRATSTVTALRNLGVGKDWLGLVVTDITPTGANPVSIEAANFFGGPNDDLATANEGGNTLSVLRNLGNGLFADPIDLSVTQGPVAVASADLNADGLADLVAASAPPSPPGILTSFLAIGDTFCPGDVNGDRFVGFDDLSLLLLDFGITGLALPADFDGNGSIDFNDLNTLLTNFGSSCP
jgi:hypothetical protein